MIKAIELNSNQNFIRTFLSVPLTDFVETNNILHLSNEINEINQLTLSNKSNNLKVVFPFAYFKLILSLLDTSSQKIIMLFDFNQDVNVSTDLLY